MFLGFFLSSKVEHKLLVKIYYRCKFHCRTEDNKTNRALQNLYVNYMVKAEFFDQSADRSYSLLLRKNEE